MADRDADNPRKSTCAHDLELTQFVEGKDRLSFAVHPHMLCGYALTRNRPHGLPSCWAWIVFPPLHDHDGVGAAQKGPNSGPSGQARDWVAPVRDEHLVRFTALVGGRLVVVHAGFASAPKNLCKSKATPGVVVRATH